MYDNEYKTKKKKNWTATYTKKMAGTNESSRKPRSAVVEIKYITSQNVERSLEMKNCLSSVKKTFKTCHLFRVVLQNQLKHWVTVKSSLEISMVTHAHFTCKRDITLYEYAIILAQRLKKLSNGFLFRQQLTRVTLHQNSRLSSPHGR